MSEHDYSGPWVDLGLHSGDDYDTAIDAINDMGGSTEAAAEYLSQWDFGDESDGAHTMPTAPWGQADTIHHVSFGGLDYVYATNHHMGYVSLNRRPLNYSV